MVFSVRPPPSAPSASSYVYALNTSISVLVSVFSVLGLFLWRNCILLHFFGRMIKKRRSPGFRSIKMLLVQVLHLRKVKPQQFRLLDFPASHHVRHLRSGYLIWKGKTLAQPIMCRRMRWGLPGHKDARAGMSAPLQPRGRTWGSVLSDAAVGHREAETQRCCRGYRRCWKRSTELQPSGRSDPWTRSWAGLGDSVSHSE